ncbi:hypothetical protein ACA910_016812 [Epithemia clementina (nom. ined.)]
MADDEDTGAPARAQFRPQEPIMGALVATARGWVAFTSGKPMADWSGRDASETQLQIPNNPLQWRHAKDDGYKYRCDAPTLNLLAMATLPSLENGFSSASKFAARR